MGYAKLIIRDKCKNKPYKDYNYNNKDAVENLIYYVFKDKDGNRKVRLYGGLGVDMTTSEKAVKQMNKIKKLYKKIGRRQMYHFILSFDERIKSPIEVYEIGMGVIDTIFYGWQVIFTVHEDKGHLHLHFILNSVNMLTGYKWHMRNDEFRNLKDSVERYADAYFERKGYDVKYADYERVTMEKLLQ